MEGINNSCEYVKFIKKFNLCYVIIIDEDRSDEFKDNCDISVSIENIFYQSPNFEKYVEKDFEDRVNFEKKYQEWCKAKFNSDESEYNKYKKINYPLYLTDDEDILSEIVKGNKLKLYSDAVKCLVKQINNEKCNALGEK